MPVGQAIWDKPDDRSMDRWLFMADTTPLQRAGQGIGPEIICHRGRRRRGETPGNEAIYDVRHQARSGQPLGRIRVAMALRIGAGVDEQQPGHKLRVLDGQHHCDGAAR